jgi:hypothetical protein
VSARVSLFLSSVAAHDLPACLDAIRSIKRGELRDWPRDTCAAPSSSESERDVDARAFDDASFEADADASAPSYAKFELSCVAHSLGAACVLAHLVQRGLASSGTARQAIARTVLLAPAGYHAQMPLLCHLVGPLLSLALRVLPCWHSIQLPSPLLRRAFAKLIADIRASSAGVRVSACALTAVRCVRMQRVLCS